MKKNCRLITFFVVSVVFALGLSHSAYGAWELVKAFAFGADDFTRPTYNDPSVEYIKIISTSTGSVAYDAGLGYGYTDQDGLDLSPNNRGDYTGNDEIYDQFIGVKTGDGSPPIVFRIDVEPGKEYRFVAAGGDADNADHENVIRARDGDTATVVILVDGHIPPGPAEFWTVEFEDKVVPPFENPPVAGQETPTFAPQPECPILAVTSDFINIEQDIGTAQANGGDLCFLEVWVKSVAVAPDVTTNTGQRVTLSGEGPADTTSWQWVQISGQEHLEPALQPNANSQEVWFDTPASDVGYMLEFQLTVVSPLEGTGSDIATVYVYAPNPPAIPPPNVRALPGDFGALGLGFTLRWDELFDANSYQLALKLGDAYFWIYNTTETSFEFSGMAENAEQIVAVRGMNDYPGDGVQSEDMPYVALSNVAPAASASFDYEGNPVPGMNDGAITDNNSWGTSVQTEDLWGYQWDAPQIFDHVVYYTGAMGTYGGWFTDLKVQYTQDGAAWEDVPIMDIFPPLDLTDQRAGKQALTRYDISIPTVSGTGIRIYGTPGGAGTFTSVAELDVFGNQQASQPVVYGLDATFGERSTAVLDGSYSFSTAGPLSGFEWQQVIVGGEPAVTIADPTQAKTSFEAPGVDADTVFSFTFTAGDGVGTDTDDVTITIKNLVTTAVAGPDQVAYEGTTVTLDGNGSMTTTGDLTFSWTQKEGTIVALDGANTATPSFTAPAIWGYNENLVFDLEVDDGAAGVSTDSVTVTVKNLLEGDLAGDPWGLKTLDISGPVDNPNNIRGSTTYDSDTQTYTMSADGEDIWNTDDGFRFAYMEVGSDFSSISVRLDNPPSLWPNGWTKVGLMVRQDLDPNSVFMMVIASRDNGMVQQYRTTKGGGAARQGGDGARQPYEDESLNFTGPVWLRLERQGDLWVGYYSYDGTAWVFGDVWNYPTQHTIPFQEPFYAGIAITSHDGGALGTAIYGDLMFNDEPASVLTDAYAVRELPGSYQAGGTADVSLSLRVNPDNTPGSVNILENVPAGIPDSNVTAPGATVSGGKIIWALSDDQVEMSTISYSLNIPAEMTQGLDFSGTVSFGTTSTDIFGDNLVYAVPSAPQYVQVEMLAAAHLSWSSPPEQGIQGYTVYRSADGGAWEEIATLSGTSYVDKWVVAGVNYSYQVSATNVRGSEGTLSAPTEQASLPTMQIVEAEDFNHSAGSYPGYEDCPAGIESPDGTLGTPDEYDYYHPNTGGPDPAEYRTNDGAPDGLGVEIVEEVDDPGVDHINIGWIDAGSWWRYTFNVTQPGWIKLSFRVASPSGAILAAYWDETLIGTSETFVTGNYHIFTWVALEDQVQTTAGEHTLRVEAVTATWNFDKFTIGWDWTAPARKVIWQDPFEDYTTTQEVIDNGGWEIINGSTDPDTGDPAPNPDAAWQLWDVDTPLSGETNIPGMSGNFMVSNSDASGAGFLLDEELISPEIDCAGWTKLRLVFNKNYYIYGQDADHLQIAEADIRVFDDVTGWGEWINIFHLDTTSVPAGTDPPMLSGPEQLDLSAYDGKTIQLRWRFYDAEFDYWFAVDDIVVSGEQLAPPKGRITAVTYDGTNVSLTWTAFGDGTYYVEYTTDLTSGVWDTVAGPLTETTWTTEMPGDAVGFSRIRSAAP